MVRARGRDAGAGRRAPEADAVYLPPCEPGKIVCVHLNFRSRAVEFGRDLEGETPTYFMKPPGALNVHRGDLVRPADCHWLNYEGEIAAIVGRALKDASPDRVWDHIAGFAPANDVGAHDFRDTDAVLFRTLFDDGFPGLFDAAAARIFNIIRSSPERRVGAHSV